MSTHPASFVTITRLRGTSVAMSRTVPPVTIVLTCARVMRFPYLDLPGKKLSDVQLGPVGPQRDRGRSGFDRCARDRPVGERHDVQRVCRRRRHVQLGTVRRHLHPLSGVTCDRCASSTSVLLVRSASIRKYSSETQPVKTSYCGRPSLRSRRASW